MNKINWQVLRSKQRNLDEHIMIEHELSESDVIQDRILALLVELGEVANSVENFKYWKINKRDDRQDTLEELVDNLHFILSLENYYDFKYQGIGAIKEVTLTDQFNSLFFAVASLSSDKVDKSVELVSIRGFYIGLTEMLDFAPTEIEQAYNRKYEINFERQLQNY